MRLPRLRLTRVLASAAVSVLVLAGCGDDTIDDTHSSTDETSETAITDAASPTSAPAADAATGPTVSIPNALPTELVITDLTEGTGDPAEVGDVVVVNYVGVRSVDGTEFDSSYDRGQPISVTLGEHGVIQGWEDGLLGAKQGGRRQLDIPSDLAYGDQDKGEIIKAGDALSFVLDIVAVVSAGDPADEPDVAITGGPNQEKIDIQDLLPGDGPVVQQGQTVAVQIVAFRADTGEKLTSTWAEGGTPFTFALGDPAILAGVELATEGMKVGGRRQVIVPYLLAFGEDGNEGFGLPAKTDMVLVVDLIAAY